MKANNPSARVHAHLKHNKRDMAIELLLIALTMIVLCAVIAWMQYHPEQIKQSTQINKKDNGKYR